MKQAGAALRRNESAIVMKRNIYLTCISRCIGKPKMDEKSEKMTFIGSWFVGCSCDSISIQNCFGSINGQNAIFY